MKQVFGAIVMAVGIMVASISGLCTGFFLVLGVSGLTPLVVAMLAGLGLVGAGVAIQRSDPARRSGEGGGKAGDVEAGEGDARP